MNKINKILVISWAISSLNAFAIGGYEEKNTSFYLKGLGGRTYSHDIKVKTVNLNDLDKESECRLESDLSIFGQVGIGLKYQPMRTSFEIDYIKPFGKKFINKDSDKMEECDTTNIRSHLLDSVDKITNEKELYDFVNGTEYRFSRKGLGQEPVRIKSLLGDVVKENSGKSLLEKKNNIKNAIKNAPDKSFEPKDKLGDLSALAAHLTKSEVKMELEDYHVFVGRVSFDIVDSDNYSLYISSGVGFSYFGGNIKLQSDGKSPNGPVAEVSTVKLKPNFYPTGLVGVGMGYKINDSMSLIAQYDFTFTSADLVCEKTEIISTVDGITSASPISDEKEKIGKIDLYNHNFGVGLKIQF